MRKYIGRYRVLVEREANGDLTEEDFTYIVGTGNFQDSKIYRYNSTTLGVYILGSTSQKANAFIAKMNTENIPMIECDTTDIEATILFDEKYVHKVASMIKAKTSGAKTKPESILNHPNKDAIRQERYDALTDEQKGARRIKGEILKQRLENSKKNKEAE